MAGKDVRGAQCKVPAMFPTPNANEDSYRIKGDSQQSNGLGGSFRRQALSEGVNEQLSPTWVEWLMSWPIGWTDLEPMDPAEVAYWLDVPTDEWFAEEAGAMQPHTWERPTIRRTTAKIQHRVGRLKALGNGQVPAVVVAAWNLLMRRGGWG